MIKAVSDAPKEKAKKRLQNISSCERLGALKVINNLNETNMILTRKTYWSNLNSSTKSYWLKVASKYPGQVICTHRPNAREFRGSTSVRRASTGGKWGRSADFKKLDVSALTQRGYTLVEA